MKEIYVIGHKNPDTDVYKRQMHAYVKGQISHMWASYICIIQFASYVSFQVFNYSSQTSIIICFIVTVSYTHLDVYKRQI